MTIAEGARRHPVLSAVVAFYIVAWLVYGLVVGSKLMAPYIGTAFAGWLVSRRVDGSAARRPVPSPSHR